MASTISAGTTSGTALNMAADTTGNLAFTTQAGANTITVPNATGTMMVSGNMPAFAAYQSSAQAIGTATFTKVSLQTEEFDTNSCFNNTASTVGGIPAYSFLPNVAGYYQFTGVASSSTTTIDTLVSFFKNGTEFKRLSYISANTIATLGGSALIYCNGTTDYVSLYVYLTTPQNLIATAKETYFQAVMVRAA
jgi:hypothetical protein